MPGTIPDVRFRLPHTFSANPELVVDEGPAKDLLVGQNARGAQIEALYLGKHAEPPHRGVWLDTRGAHVVYVMGKRRSGKSYTLGAIAEGLVSSSWIKQGSKPQAVLILDTMNVFLTMPFGVSDTFSEEAAPVRDLQKWKLEPEQLPVTLYAPAGTTMPAEVQAKTITLRASDLGPEEWCGLFDVDPIVDPMGHLMSLIHAKASSGGILDKGTDAQSAPKENFDLQDLLHVLDVDQDAAGFPGDTRDALRRRLQSLSRYPLFGAGGLDIRELLQPGKLSILLLRDLEPEVRAVMVALIVRKMMQLRAVSEQHERLIPIHLARAEKLANTDPGTAETERKKAATCEEAARQGLPRSWLIIDEAHNYISAKSSVPSHRPIKKYVDEGRNLGLSIVVATQQPAGLDPSIQRNADILLIHSLSHHDDIAAAHGMINTAVAEEITLDGKTRITGARSFESLVRALPIGYAIASNDRANRLFPIRVRPRTSFHGGGDY